MKSTLTTLAIACCYAVAAEAARAQTPILPKDLPSSQVTATELGPIPQCELDRMLSLDQFEAVPCHEHASVGGPYTLEPLGPPLAIDDREQEDFQRVEHPYRFQSYKVEQSL